MTDFVNRLLGRSEHPAIRPALPTLFEPSRYDDPDDLPFGVFSPAPVCEVPPAAGLALGQATPPTQPGPAASAPPPAINNVAAKGVTVPAVSPLPLARDTREIVRSTTVHERSLIASPTETSPVVDRGEPVSSFVPAPTPSAPMAPSSPHRAPGPPPQPYPPVRRAAAARVEIPQQRPATSRGARRDPDVHVTIGRVEIKAATAASARPQHNPTASRRPRVTLEDYLKARES